MLLDAEKILPARSKLHRGGRMRNGSGRLPYGRQPLTAGSIPVSGKGLPQKVLRSMARGEPATYMSHGLGRRLFQARHALSVELGYNVTQTSVAKALGTTGTSIGRYEAGIKIPDLEMLERLAMVLRVTPCYLAFGCEHPMTGRDITDEETEPAPRLPTHRPRRRELESEGRDARAVPPVPIQRPAAAGARARPAARTSAPKRHTRGGR